MKIVILLYFFLFLFQIRSIAGESYGWKPTDATFDSLVFQLEKLTFQDGDIKSAYPVLDRMQQIAQTKQDTLLWVRTCYWNAWKELYQSKDSASVWLGRALERVDTIHNSYDYARLLQLKGDLLRKAGNWMEAYLIYKKLEKYFTTCNDPFRVAKIYVALGVMFRELGLFEEALTYLKEGSNLFLKAGSVNCEIKNRINISNTLYQLGNQEEAVEILESLVENPVACRDTAYLINVMVSLYTVTEALESPYPQMSYRLAVQFGDESLMAMTLISIGAHSLYHYRNDSALFYYRKALKLNQKYHNVYQLSPILNGLAEAHRRSGRLDSAYYYLAKYETHRDSLLDSNKITEINRIESRAAIEKYELELKQEQEKHRLHRNLMIVIVVSVSGFCLLFCYIFWTLRRKEKIRKQYRELENKELNVQLQNQTLRNENFQLEIDSKNRELSSTTLILTRKNQVLKDLLKEIDQLGKESILPENRQIPLKKQIKDNLAVDDEWEYFKLHFEKVHPDYFRRLKEMTPGLSENELRLCAYIRIGMSNKQIAQLLSVLPDTVNTGRYRIRKKMGLKQEEILEDILRSV